MKNINPRLDSCIQHHNEPETDETCEWRQEKTYYLPLSHCTAPQTAQVDDTIPISAPEILMWVKECWQVQEATIAQTTQSMRSYRKWKSQAMGNRWIVAESIV